jgi:23S rRNA (cytidine1920-2'-O)/16S rRNA (cytidine1409-2'-O)-methyltransferase
MGKRERLDKLLVDRGLVKSREEGQGLILAGAVLVDEVPATKAGSRIESTAAIRLKRRSPDYVSRGGTKLEGAFRDLQIDVEGKIVLDVGASTGGFSDCLLKHGARRIYAVDVGYGQLAWKLRQDPRVVVLEKQNIRYLEPSDLPEQSDFATIDVSFISLRLVFPAVKRLLTPAGEILALIKPQFEVGKGKVGKGGVVRNAEDHRRVIEEIKAAAEEMALVTQGIAESCLLGPKGNKEFFIRLGMRL